METDSHWLLDWARRKALYGTEGAHFDRVGLGWRGAPKMCGGYPDWWIKRWLADPENYWRYVRDYVVWC